MPTTNNTKLEQYYKEQYIQSTIDLVIKETVPLQELTPKEKKNILNIINSFSDTEKAKIISQIIDNDNQFYEGYSKWMPILLKTFDFDFSTLNKLADHTITKHFLDYSDELIKEKTTKDFIKQYSKDSHFISLFCYIAKQHNTKPSFETFKKIIKNNNYLDYLNDAEKVIFWDAELKSFEKWNPYNIEKTISHPHIKYDNPLYNEIIINDIFDYPINTFGYLQTEVGN